jgi:hypothetical protein
MRWAILGLLLSACSGDSVADMGLDDMAVAPDLSFATPPLATLTDHGGPVLAAPAPVIVVWPGDESLGERLNAFHEDLFASYVWGKTFAQYRVGRGTAKGIVVLPDAKPATIAHDSIPSLVSGVAAGLTVDANTVIVVLIPVTTTETGVPANELGYHNEIGGVPFIVLRQTTTATIGSTTFEDLTYFASHELAEAATDPFLNTQPAWFAEPLSARFGEIADLCNPLPQSIYAVADGGMPSFGGTYLAARFYSNSAAAMPNTDPCWGPGKGTYFYVGASPQVATTSVELSFIAPSDVGPIDWQIGGAPTGVVVTPASGTNSVGDHVSVTISAPTGTAPFSLAAVGTSAELSSVYDFLVQP